MKHRRIWTLVLPLALVAAGCDSVLEVPDPDVATPGDLANENALPAAIAGAIGDFVVAYDGAGLTEGIVPMVGLFTDEFIHSGTFDTRFQMESRQIEDDNGTLSGVYLSMHQARRATEDVAGTIEDVRGPGDADATQLLGLAGYLYNAFGEVFCSGVPFSEVDGGTIVDGTPQTTDQIFERAVQRFQAALDNGGGDQEAVYTAQVGLGRALLNLGRYAEAAQAVAAVPTDFVTFMEHSANTGRQQNPLFNLNASNKRWSVADGESPNGIPYRSADDPRVPWSNPDEFGFDSSTPLYNIDKYQTRSAGTVLADGVEARLIEAEAALQAGQPDQMLSILNEMRANVAALMTARIDGPYSHEVTVLPDLTDPGTQDGRVDLLFEERAFWLYATGHRLGDYRRLVRQYDRGSETVYPAGPYFKGGNYGDDLVFPVPFDELNNPEFSGCLSGGA